MSLTAEQVDEQRRERLARAIAQAAERLPMNEVCTLLADEADALLCDGLGVSGATRWWRRYTLETCGRACGDG